MFKRLVLMAAFAAMSLMASDTQQQMEHYAQKWAHRLKLDDWKIRLEMVSVDELPDNALAYSEHSDESRVIWITIIDPREYPALAKKYRLTYPSVNKFLHQAIVHELVHLRVDDLSKSIEASEEETHAEEILVVRLTAALMNLDRL